MTEHHLADWTPREDVIISFADQTGAVRTQEELDQMFEEFREVANQHGFHPDGWGLDQSFRAFYTGSTPRRMQCLPGPLGHVLAVQRTGWTHLGRT